MRRASLGSLSLVVLLAGAGCGDDDPIPQQMVESACEMPSGACGLTACAPEQLEARHVDTCSSIDWPTNPPTSGQHFPIWAAFQDYTEAVPRGFWLHSAEHSAVVLAYNCDFADDCAALTSELTSFAASVADDPLCDAAVGNRIIVTPDPLLDAAFAAVAWGHYLKGSCFDEAPVQSFVDQYYGMNYENFCSGGVDPTDPSEGFPADCGQ